jgi:hypothetical protein
LSRSSRIEERVQTTASVLGAEAENFLKTVVGFPAVPTGVKPELLLRVVDRLCTELGCAPESDGIPAGERHLSDQLTRSGYLRSEDEALVQSMRQRLARLAAAAADLGEGSTREGVIVAALSGVEMVMRGELAKGEGGDLASLVPSFVYLVTLPALDLDDALHLSRRASEMIDGLPPA